MKLAERITQLELVAEQDPSAEPSTAAGTSELVLARGHTKTAADSDQIADNQSECITKPRAASSLSAARAPMPLRRTRRSVLAPALLGSAAAAAIEQLRSCGLNPAVELQETDEQSVHGTVIAQEPQAGEELARGATLALWVAAPHADQIVAVNDHAEPANPSPTASGEASVAAECEAQSVDALDDGWFDLPGASVPSSEPDEIDRACARVPAVSADRDELDSSDAAPGDGSPTQTRIRYALATIAVGVVLLVLGRALMPQQDTPSPQAPTGSTVPASVGRNITDPASGSRDQPRVVQHARPHPARTVRPRAQRATRRRAVRPRRALARGMATGAASPPAATVESADGRRAASPPSQPQAAAPALPRQSQVPSSSSRTVEREFFTP